MTILITGGTGFLGRHIIDRLIADGETNLRVLSRSADAELEELGVEFVEGSLLSAEDLGRAVQGVDRVFHLAGRVERDRSKSHLMYSLHVDGTRMLLDALRDSNTEVKKIVVASTSGTVGVGESSDFMADDDSPHAESIVRNWPYYLSKIYAERLCFDYVARFEMPIVQMRPTLLLGPGDFRESSTGDVVLFLNKKVPGVIEGGMSFVDVRDTATAFVKAMEVAEGGETYLLGAENLKVRDFFERLSSITGLPAPKMAIPDTFVRLGSKLLSALSGVTGTVGDVDPVSLEMARHYWYIDSSRAHDRLDWTPRDPNTTLRDTVSWLYENHPDFQSEKKERPDPPPEYVSAETVEFARTLRQQYAEES